MPWARVGPWSWSEVAVAGRLAIGLVGEKRERPRRAQVHFLSILSEQCLSSLTVSIRTAVKDSVEYRICPQSLQLSCEATKCRTKAILIA